jgi:hypothetical protein
MTYQQTIQRFKEIIEAHKFIQTYGYGNLSDIAVPDNEEPPNYPYAFINPINCTINQNTFDSTFNLIVMTQVLDKEDDELFGQSNCIKYINDILAQFQLTNNDPLMQVSLPVQTTPFKERFQDDVVGATAVVTIRYGKPMSVCDSPITGIEPSEPYCPQTLVVDGDGSNHFLDAGDSYTCLPAVARRGIFYQRQIPWDGNDPSIDYSVYWHLQQGTYRYTPPESPRWVAVKADNYFGDDTNCVLMQQNVFENFYRFTNDRGQQFVEDFHRDPRNESDNPQYCIDHLLGLGFYVQRSGFFPQGEGVYRTFPEGMQYAHDFEYAGFSDWRLIDIGEYLEAVSYNDWQNSYGGVYAPFVDPYVRQYGAMLMTGSFTKDNKFIRIQTNGPTVREETNSTATSQHLIMVRNHFW